MLMCIEFVDAFFCGLCTQNLQFEGQTASSRLTGSVTDMPVLRPSIIQHGYMPGAFLLINPNPFSAVKIQIAAHLTELFLQLPLHPDVEISCTRSPTLSFWSQPQVSP